MIALEAMVIEIGMLIVETIAKIRRAHFIQGKAIKTICRELGASRKVVRKVVRSEATEFRYQRTVQPRPKLGPWRSALDDLLSANAGKAPRERLTLIFTSPTPWDTLIHHGLPLRYKLSPSEFALGEAASADSSALFEPLIRPSMTSMHCAGARR